MLRIEAWIQLGDTLGRMGRLEQAAQVLGLAGAGLGDTPDRTLEARMRNMLGVVLGRQGRFGEAREQIERGRAIDESLHGADSPTQAPYVRNLVVVLRRLDRQDEALAQSRRMIDMVRIWGDDHPDVGRARRDLGQLYSVLGRYREAISELEAARAILASGLGKDHLDVALCDDNAALALSRAGDHAGAVTLMRRASAVYQAREPGLPRTLGARANLALELGSTGELDEAEHILTEVLTAQIATLGKTHVDVGNTHRMRAEVAHLARKLDEAEREYLAARRIYEATHGAEHTRVAAVDAGLAGIERDRSRPRKALALDEQALRVRRKVLPATHRELIQSLRWTAHDHLLVGDAAGALQLIEEALRIAEIENNPVEVQELRFVLARALWDSRRDRPRAVALAREARDVLAAQIGGGVVIATDVAAITEWLAARR